MIRYLSTLAILAASFIPSAVFADDVYMRVKTDPIVVGSNSADDPEIPEETGPLALTPASQELRGRVGLPMDGVFSGTGGKAPYRWSIANAPSWISMNNGVLSGTPLETGLWNVDVGLIGAGPDGGDTHGTANLDVRLPITYNTNTPIRYVQVGMDTTTPYLVRNRVGGLKFSFTGAIPEGQYSISQPTAPQQAVVTWKPTLPQGEYAATMVVEDDWDGRTFESDPFTLVVGNLGSRVLPTSTTFSTIQRLSNFAVSTDPEYDEILAGQTIEMAWEEPVRVSHCVVSRKPDGNSAVFRFELQDEQGNWHVGSEDTYSQPSVWIATSDSCGGIVPSWDGMMVQKFRLVMVSGSMKITTLVAGFQSSYAYL